MTRGMQYSVVTDLRKGTYSPGSESHVWCNSDLTVGFVLGSLGDLGFISRILVLARGRLSDDSAMPALRADMTPAASR